MLGRGAFWKFHRGRRQAHWYVFRREFFCSWGSRDKLGVRFIQSLLRPPYVVLLRVVTPHASADNPVPFGISSGLGFASSTAHSAVVVLKSVSWSLLGHPTRGKWL